MLLSYPGEEVVPELPDGSQNALHDSAPGAVGRQKGDKGAQSGQQSDYHQDKERVAQPFHLFRICLFHLFAPPAPADGENTVLEHSQRADDRTVDPAEDQGQHQQDGDRDEIGCEDCRQQLDLGKPTEPSLNRPCEVQEKQRDCDEAEYGEYGSDFL